MAFLENIEVNWFSMVPVILILVSFLQAMIFRSYSSGEDDLTTNNTAYSFIETDEKAYRSGMKWHSICKLVVILPLFLLVIYFPSLHKVIVCTSPMFLEIVKIHPPVFADRRFFCFGTCQQGIKVTVPIFVCDSIFHIHILSFSYFMVTTEKGSTVEHGSDAYAELSSHLVTARLYIIG